MSLVDNPNVLIDKIISDLNLNFSNQEIRDKFYDTCIKFIKNIKDRYQTLQILVNEINLSSDVSDRVLINIEVAKKQEDEILIEKQKEKTIQNFNEPFVDVERNKKIENYEKEKSRKPKKINRYTMDGFFFILRLVSLLFIVAIIILLLAFLLALLINQVILINDLHRTSSTVLIVLSAIDSIFIIIYSLILLPTLYVSIVSMFNKNFKEQHLNKSYDIILDCVKITFIIIEIIGNALRIIFFIISLFSDSGGDFDGGGGDFGGGGAFGSW